MTTHTFESEVWLPVARETVFPFFANARNLERLTPSWLKFTVLKRRLEQALKAKEFAVLAGIS